MQQILQILALEAKIWLSFEILGFRNEITHVSDNFRISIVKSGSNEFKIKVREKMTAIFAEINGYKERQREMNIRRNLQDICCICGFMKKYWP